VLTAAVTSAPVIALVMPLRKDQPPTLADRQFVAACSVSADSSLDAVEEIVRS